MDDKWLEVTDLADKYGFIVFCFGGVAVLATPEARKEKSPDKQD